MSLASEWVAAKVKRKTGRGPARVYPNRADEEIVMPIKPENKARYPKDWKQIRERILNRSTNRCEGSPMYPECRIGNGWYRNNTTGEICDPDGGVVEAWAFADGDSVTRIVLTIAHLDHTPEHCADENLRAWCQRCHLAYDHEHHQRNAYETRRKGKALQDMFA